MTKGSPDTATGNNFKDYLPKLGFVEVQKKAIEWSCGPWPEEEARKMLGKMQRQNVSMALKGVSRMLFMKQFGWTKEEVGAILQEALKDLDDLEKHIHNRV